MVKKSVGTQLRDGRQAKQLSLDNLEDLTGIKSPFLLAIEMDQFALLPSKAYEISYIKKFAQAVDLDDDSILRDYHLSVAEKQEQLLNKQKMAGLDLPEENYSRTQVIQHTATSHREKPKKVNLSQIFLLTLLALLVLTVLFIFLGRPLLSQLSSNAGTPASEPSQSVTATSTTTASTSPSSSSESPNLTVTPSVDGVTLSANLSHAQKPVDIVLTLTEDSTDKWFAVSNSNYESGSFLNQETTTARVVLSEETQETTITLGASSGVTITVNGQDLDLSTLSPDATGYITLMIE